MKKAMLFLGLFGLIFFFGCTAVENSSNKSETTTDSTLEMTTEIQGTDDSQEEWLTVDEFSIDMDGDQSIDKITVEERFVSEGYMLRVTTQKDVFTKVFAGYRLTAESYLLEEGTHGQSLLVILNETETANDSQEVRFYDKQLGAYIFDFADGKLLPMLIEGKTISSQGEYRFALSLTDKTLQIRDHISGMGVSFEIDLTEDQMQNLPNFDANERVQWLNTSGFNRIRISPNGKQLICEKSIPGVMHQDTFATIRFLYTYLDGCWQTVEEVMITDNPKVYAVQKIAPETETKVWNNADLDRFFTADLETLLGYYHETIDGCYAEGFASKLSVLYTELGARKILTALSQVDEKNVLGITKLLIGERLIEFGEAGRVELQKDFGMLLVISAMSAEEAKTLTVVMEALDETSDWMK